MAGNYLIAYGVLACFVAQSYVMVQWVAEKVPLSLTSLGVSGYAEQSPVLSGRNALVGLWLVSTGALSVAVTVLPVKAGMLVRTVAHLLCSKDKGYKSPGDPNSRSDFMAHQTEERTVIFIRHGESTWNETFNKSKLPWKFLPRVVKAVLTELTLVLRVDSWFFDAPLNLEGMDQAEKLHRFITAPLPKKDRAAKSNMYDALRGEGAEDDSIVVSSTLRRALSTVAIGLRSRFRRKPSERIKMLSALQEISRNPDTLCITPKVSYEFICL